MTEFFVPCCVVDGALKSFVGKLRPLLDLLAWTTNEPIDLCLPVRRMTNFIKTKVWSA